MKKSVCFVLLWTLFFGASCQNIPLTDSPSRHNLRFNRLATDWENGIPLGNGILGQMVGRHHAHLRFSLGSRPCAPWKISAHRNGISAGCTDNGFVTITTQYRKILTNPTIEIPLRPKYRLVPLNLTSPHLAPFARFTSTFNRQFVRCAGKTVLAC